MNDLRPREPAMSMPAAYTTLALLAALVMAPATLHSQGGMPHATPTATCEGPIAEPTPVRDLAPVVLRYEGTFVVGGRSMPITSTLAVAPHPAGGWAVAERAVLPRGLAVDSARLDARTLAPRERTTTQGATQVTLAFTGDSAIGMVATGDHSRPLAAALCGSLVGDGAGAFLVLGRLPLAAGYHTVLQHLDIRTATTTRKVVAVIARERLSVPGGDFDTWKVRVSEDGTAGTTTIWVDTVSLVPVMFSSSQGPVTITMAMAK